MKKQARHAPAPPNPAGPRENTRRIASLERDLARAHDHRQSTQHDHDSATRKLQASNQVGRSANEKLQSLNGEMTDRNTELNRLNNDLTNLQTSANLVILLLGRDLKIRRFSAQAESLFHLRPSDLGRSITRIRHNLPVPDLKALVLRVMTRGRECVREVQDKAGHWYSLRVRPYLTADHKVEGAVFLLMDIDASKQAGQDIIRSRDFAEAVIGTVRDPLLILDDELRVRKVNEAFLTTFKMAATEVLGHRLFELDRRRWESSGLRALLLKILPRKSVFDNFEVTKKFGRIGHRTFLLNARMLSQDPGHREKILLGFQDITERKRADEALRLAESRLSLHAEQLEATVTRRTAQLTTTNQRLASSLQTVRRTQAENRAHLVASQRMQKKLRHLTHQILTSQEEERKKISRELHDEVVQTLVSINVELSTLLNGNSPDLPQLKDKIARTQRLVESSVDAVHRFARDLRPAVLDDLGLIPALHAFCEGLAERKKLKIDLTAFARVETLASDKRTVLFRVAQEALNNVARHAHASQVKVTIAKLPGAIRLEVADDGKSFSVRTIFHAKTKRLGLLGMRERVEMVGGQLTIESAPGHGTTVRADIPFSLEPLTP